MGTFEAAYDFRPSSEIPIKDVQRKFDERSGMKSRLTDLGGREGETNLKLDVLELLPELVSINLSGSWLTLSYASAVPSEFLLGHLEAVIRECGGRPSEPNTSSVAHAEARKWMDLSRWERLRERWYWLRALIPPSRSRRAGHERDSA